MSSIKNKTMLFLWSGAAISIAEIYTGGLAAPLGLVRGITAILIGHLIGGLLLSLGGVISCNSRKNAMNVVKDALGDWGAKLVALLNIIQLLGWSAVMLIQGARGITSTLGLPYTLSLSLMALLVFMWAYFFANKSKVINDVAVLVLLVLTCLMFYQIDFGRPISSKPALSFMMVVEMSIAMPVSWLPLIGDYTSQGENSRGVFWSTFLGYFVASSSMFILGLLITLFTGKDIIEFISSFAMPLAACAIIVLSTVTTTFLDIFSAVESSRQLFSIKRPGLVTAIYCGIGFALSLYFPIEDYESFLLTIGSVFIPVYSIVIMNYFLPEPGIRRNFVGVASVVGGCVLYNYFLTKSILSPTLLILGILPLLYLPVVKLVNRNSIPESGQ